MGLFVGLTMMSMLTADAEDMPKMEGVDSMLMSPNQLATERLNEIVGDYIRWEII